MVLNNKRLRNEWKAFIEKNMNIQLFSTLTFPTGVSEDVGKERFHSFWTKIAKHFGEEIWCFYGYERQPSRDGPSIHFHVLTEFENSKIIPNEKMGMNWWIDAMWSFDVGGSSRVEIYNPEENGVAYALLNHQWEDRFYCPRIKKACDRRSQCVYKRNITKWRERHLSLV